MPTREIDAATCHFAVDVETEQNSAGSKTAKVRLRARTSEPVGQAWSSPVVHDFAGMEHGNRIAIDYNHSDDVVGYINRFEVDADGLLLSGVLTPFKDDDKASELIAKMSAGIPYEASIAFPGPMAIEEVDEGQEVEVNGRRYAGPVDVVRQWRLRSVAITPMGRDHLTGSELYSESGTVTAQIVEPEMTAENQSPEVDEVEAPAETVEATEGEHIAEAETETVEAVEASESEETPEPVTAGVEGDAEFSETEGQRFLSAFGDRGGVWYAQGMSFDDAQAKFNAELQSENDDLRARIAELEKAEQGAEFSASDIPAKKSLEQAFATRVK